MALLGCTGSIGAPDAPGSTGGVGNGSGAPGTTGGGRPTGGGTSSGSGTGAGSSSAPAPFEARMLRLTSTQYRNVVTDVFGANITVPTLDPEAALGGFAAVGASRVGTSKLGVSHYADAAQQVTKQAFADAGKRATLAGCSPTNAKAADDACAGKAIASVGRLLLRRPLTTDEQTRYVGFASEAARATSDFWEGLRFAFEALLQTPSFLYRAELGEPTGKGDTRALRGVELASRLSFATQNTAPSGALLDAALAGELDTSEGLGRWAGMLLGTDKAARNRDDVFAEMLELPDAVDPDTTAMRQETLLVLRELETQKLPYTSLFTAPFTFVNDALAMRYGLPDRPGSALKKVTLPAGNRQGLLGQASVLYQGRDTSNPIARGKFVREALLCQVIPPPPPGLNPVLPEASAGAGATVRERLTKHREDPSCAACHAQMDPIGLGLETFDGLARYRTSENGKPIDESGDLDGATFANARGLGARIAAHPDARACAVRSLRRAMTGALEDDRQDGVIAALTGRFAAAGESIRALQTAIIDDETFRIVTPAP
jgi:hypothetical protein